MAAGIDWTEKLITRFRVLHAGGTRSFKQIAEKLSAEFRIRLTKNACIGKGRRIGLEQRPRGTSVPGPRKHKKPRRNRTQNTPELVSEIAQETVPVLPHWGITQPAETAGENRLTIYGLKSGVCHYPYGDRPPYAYCGNTTRRGMSWCPHHERVVYPHGRVR